MDRRTEKTNDGRTALLIVDTQNDFCPGGALAVPEGDEVVAPINQMVEVARKNGWPIVASRDWHPRKTTHFAEFGGVWPVHCVQNTDGAKFHPDLDLDGATIISKGMGADEDAYSAFDGVAEDGESLADFLRGNGITDLIVVGLAADYCVKHTVISGTKEKFQVTLLADATRAVDMKPGDGEKAIQEMKDNGARISTTDELLNAFVA